MNMSVKNARSIQSVTITDCMLSLEEFIAVAKYGAKVEFAPEMIETVNANRKLLDKFLKEGRIIYGVTTGFGENVRYTISPEDANTLQENIVRTHSVAVGEPLDREQARRDAHEHSQRRQGPFRHPHRNARPHPPDAEP